MACLVAKYWAVAVRVGAGLARPSDAWIISIPELTVQARATPSMG